MIGKRIGQLTITRKLGEGAFGAVYLAQHHVLGSLSAIKILLPQWSADQTMVQRFVNEARAASSIAHPAIVDVGDCGQLDDGIWYIVMPYLEGGTLEAFLHSQGGPISQHLALEILAPVGEALEKAHARKIVHCDLKPANIYLTQNDKSPHYPKLLDFGVARMMDQTGGIRTAPGMIAGTLVYMAPEQIYDRRKVDNRSDVYALGVILYQMVTGGWLPFQRPEDPGAFLELAPAAVFMLQKETAPIDPRLRGARITEGFAMAILTALQFRHEQRPQSVRALFLLLAEATPGDELQRSGVEILRDLARDLLKVTSLTETVRGTKPAAAKSRYQLGDKLGEGGMAEVFRATAIGAEGFERAVAIKRIRPEYSALPRFAQMFITEAQIVSQLNHTNIVSVLDFDHDDEGRLYMVLELVEGVDLDRLCEAGVLPDAVIIYVIAEILAGLDHAHHLPAGASVPGVVHRDMSPRNVLVSWDGAVKVSDFGLAKPREGSQASGSVELRGKAAYMSPEQIDGQSLDGRADLFAVGIMLHQLLTGQPLFRTDDARETIFRVMHRPIPRPSLVRPLSPELEAVTLKLLERDPAARYPTARAAADALLACPGASPRARADLQQLLGARFSDEARKRRRVATRPANEPRPGHDVRPAPAHDVPPVPPWSPPLTQTVPPSSVSMAASESIGTATRRVRRLPAALTVAVVAAIASVVLAVSLGLRRRGMLDPPQPVKLARPAGQVLPPMTGQPVPAAPTDAAVAPVLDASIAAASAPTRTEQVSSGSAGRSTASATPARTAASAGPINSSRAPALPAIPPQRGARPTGTAPGAAVSPRGTKRQRDPDEVGGE